MAGSTILTILALVLIFVGGNFVASLATPHNWRVWASVVLLASGGYLLGAT